MAAYITAVASPTKGTMSTPLLPLLVEPETLERFLDDERLFLVDLCHHDSYANGHIQGAINMDYAQIVRAQPPMLGLLPDIGYLSDLFSNIGLRRDHHLVAYDEEGGSRACRLLWTLDVVGHRDFSLLNGGVTAWQEEHRPLVTASTKRPSTRYRIDRAERGIADIDYVLAHLNDPDVALLDTRSVAEFNGTNKRANRVGHIPGARNFDWVNAMDHKNALRLKPAEELRAALHELGITPDKEIIAYCQTHHRSAHTYFVLKTLGYPRIRGYAGSWSEWGNRPDTPIE